MIYLPGDNSGILQISVFQHHSTQWNSAGTDKAWLHMLRWSCKWGHQCCVALLQYTAIALPSPGRCNHFQVSCYTHTALPTQCKIRLQHHCMRQLTAMCVSGRAMICAMNCRPRALISSLVSLWCCCHSWSSSSSSWEKSTPGSSTACSSVSCHARPAGWQEQC